MTRGGPHASLVPVVPAFLVLSFALMLVSEKNRSFAAESDTQQVVKSINAFAVDLYPKLKEGNENLFFAPYSISTALAMTYAGARGATETQMAKTLHFGPDQQRLHAAFGSLAAGLAGSTAQSGCTLNLVNALWGQKGFPFLKEYQELIIAKVPRSTRRTGFPKGCRSNAEEQSTRQWKSRPRGKSSSSSLQE